MIMLYLNKRLPPQPDGIVDRVDGWIGSAIVEINLDRFRKDGSAYGDIGFQLVYSHGWSIFFG
jgi:hypothetical protein